MAVQQKFSTLAKAADVLKQLVTALSGDVEQFKSITRQYAAQIESDSNRRNAKSYLTAWFERILCFEKERLALITGKIEKAHCHQHKEFEHSRVDAYKLYKLSSREFMSVCSVDGLVDESRQLSDILNRAAESKFTRKLEKSLERIADGAESLGDALETAKASLRNSCNIMESRLKQMKDPFVSAAVATRVPGSESVCYQVCANGERVQITRADAREIGMVDARSTTIEDLKAVVLAGGATGRTSHASSASAGVQSLRRVVDQEEEHEERERVEELQRRRSADKHSFLGDLGSTNSVASVRDIKLGCGVNPDALSASRERAEGEEGHENPDDLYLDEDDVYDIPGIVSTSTSMAVNSGDIPSHNAEKASKNPLEPLVEEEPLSSFALEQMHVQLQLTASLPVLANNLRAAVLDWVSCVSAADIVADTSSCATGIPKWVSNCAACIGGSRTIGVVTTGKVTSFTLRVQQHFPLRDLAAGSTKDRKVYSTTDIVLSSLLEQAVKQHIQSAKTRIHAAPANASSSLFIPRSVENGGKCINRGEPLTLPCYALSPVSLRVTCVQNPVVVLIITVFLDLVAALSEEIRDRPPVGLRSSDGDMFISTLCICLLQYVDYCQSMGLEQGSSSEPKPPFIFTRSCFDASLDFRDRAGLLNVYLWLIRIFLFGKRPGMESFHPFSHFIDHDLQYNVESAIFDADCRRVLEFHCN